MATRTKTVVWRMGTLMNIPDDTDTNFSQITIKIPESGVTIRRVVVDCQVLQNDSSQTDIYRREIGIKLGSNSYQDYANTNTWTDSKENWPIFQGWDVTSYFTTNWSGTSMTFDLRVHIEKQTETVANSLDYGTALIYITYDYDDTSTTQIVSQLIALDWPSFEDRMNTSKPGTADVTIPDLSSELPEASVSIQQYGLHFELATCQAATPYTFNYEIDSGGTQSVTFDSTLGSIPGCRYFDTTAFTTNATHDLYLWNGMSNDGGFMQGHCYLYVVYEFNASTSTTMYVTAMLPFSGQSGGLSRDDDTIELSNNFGPRSEATLHCREGSITEKRIAMCAWIAKSARIDNVRFRFGSDTISTTEKDMCNNPPGGMTPWMHRCDGSFALAQGENVFSFEYEHDENAENVAMQGFWLVNYTCAVPTDGPGVANHTVWSYLGEHPGTGDFLDTYQTPARAALVDIAESEWFASGLAVVLEGDMENGAYSYGHATEVELVSGEGGPRWLPAHISHCRGRAEGGRWVVVMPVGQLFTQYPGDIRQAHTRNDDQIQRLDAETDRHVRFAHWINAAVGTFNGWGMAVIHNIPTEYEVEVTGSDGTTVTAHLIDMDNDEVVQSKTRSGNGTITFKTWDGGNYAAIGHDTTRSGGSSVEAAS